MAFPATWTASALAARPIIVPRRCFVYPAQVEEVERGALEVMVRPCGGEPFLATFALGFAGGLSGLWSSPDPGRICAASGGYVYLVNTAEPAEWEQVAYRPVVSIIAAPAAGLLVFAGYRALIAYDERGFLWESPVLSSEGIDQLRVEGGQLCGMGWDLMSDRNKPFVIDLARGALVSGGV